MSFEIGKKYTFKENEFVKSRESGKLVFKVPDPASATPFIVKPFEFQISDIPDKIICVYKGNNRFEQDQDSVVPELYKVGEEYRFRVMRQDTNSAGHVSIRDDVRGLTFYPVDLGKVKFQRFQRITCRVISNDKGLKLSYVDEREDQKKSFTATDLRSLRGARMITSEGFVRRLTANPVFDEVRQLVDSGNPEWIAVALEKVAYNIPQWFSMRRGFRCCLLARVRELAISLIEHSEYLNVFPAEERRAMQERLSTVILECEDYLHAARLIEDGEDVEFITATLESLKSSGWLYKPEKKMRMMMALFTFKSSYVNDYIWEIFRVIRDHHGDPRFISEFADGFIMMLQLFVEHESKNINTSSHDALRRLIEAIAILLLLTADKEYPRWNLYRGRMYTLAMVLTGKRNDALTEKAFAALSDRLEMPLEYSWGDLSDVNRLCHVSLGSLSRMAGKVRLDSSVSIFEGQNANLSVSDSVIRMSPVLTGSNTREAISLPVSRNHRFDVMLNDRPDSRVAEDDLNLSHHHLMWRDLEASLFDRNQRVTQDVPAAAKEPIRILPQVNDTVLFRVTGRLEGSPYDFTCVIEDPLYEGRGTINTRDIVAYPLQARIESFCSEDGDPLILTGVVKDLLPDGTFAISAESNVDEHVMRIARQDKDEEAEVEAVVTRDLGDSCLAVTDMGYPVLINKHGRAINNNQTLVVSIVKVSWNNKSDKPYVEASFLRYASEDVVERHPAVTSAFGVLMNDVAGGRVWHPQPEAEEPEAVETPVEEISGNYLSAEAVNELSRLFDAMAYVADDDIAEAYSDLAVARLLSLVTGDNYRAQFLALKQSLVEGLSRFVIDGRVDRGELDDLTKKISQFPINDVDLVRRLEILRVLSGMDAPASGSGIAVLDDSDSSLIGSLKRLVTSYNMLRGLRLNPLRQELKRAIYDTLNLKMPQIDVSRVNASEDQYHEFKESLVYPAGNAMLPDERKQGREIAEIVCGMLNSGGGTLYIGVTNGGVPRGLQDDFIYLNNGFEEYDLDDVKDKFSLRFCRVLREHFGLTVDGVQIYPDYVNLEYDNIDDKWFAVVTVRPFPGAVWLTDGAMFIRQDSSTLPVKKKSEQSALAKNRKV